MDKDGLCCRGDHTEYLVHESVMWQSDKVTIFCTVHYTEMMTSLNSNSWELSIALQGN